MIGGDENKETSDELVTRSDDGRISCYVRTIEMRQREQPGGVYNTKGRLIMLCINRPMGGGASLGVDGMEFHESKEKGRRGEGRGGEERDMMRCIGVKRTR